MTTDVYTQFLAKDNHHKPEAFDYAMQRMFAGVTLRGARVLEIGSGRGLLAIWMAQQGAARVVSMEPEMVGATSGVVAEQRRRVAALGLEGVVEVVVADFNTWQAGEQFDVIVSRASLNHLYASDQHAAYHLPTWAGYVTVANRIGALLAPGGVFVATDACRYSLFGLLRRFGIRRPWNRKRSGVDWRHHQTPATWQRIFRAAGFASSAVTYPVGYPLRRWERWAGTRLANACLKGAFILHARVG
jgi:SAM-dependent methyltransferase